MDSLAVLKLAGQYKPWAEDASFEDDVVRRFGHDLAPLHPCSSELELAQLLTFPPPAAGQNVAKALASTEGLSASLMTLAINIEAAALVGVHPPSPETLSRSARLRRLSAGADAPHSPASVDPLPIVAALEAYSAMLGAATALTTWDREMALARPRWSEFIEAASEEAQLQWNSFHLRTLGVNDAIA